tara:strand:- start:3307 stop:3897 length:591 start_codon:yes stop_codon:yes gene_type:complete
MDTTATPRNEKIACLGWGSLIWDTSRPFAVKGDWLHNGPSLPLEFARQSGGNRMTLVIANIEHHVTVLWAELDVASLDQAVLLLAEREDVPNARVIGRWPNQTEEQYLHQSAIAEWAISQGLTGVVWTALPTGMKKARGLMPTLAEVKTYLAGLSSVERVGAIEYIHRAPTQIETPYRSALESSFPFQDTEENGRD